MINLLKLAYCNAVFIEIFNIFDILRKIVCNQRPANFREAVEMGSKYIKDLQRICIYVAQDCAGKSALLSLSLLIVILEI